MLTRPYNYTTESLLDIVHHMVLANGADLISPIVENRHFAALNVFHCTIGKCELRVRLQDNGILEIVVRNYSAPLLITAVLNDQFYDIFEADLICVLDLIRLDDMDAVYQYVNA